MSKIQKIKTHVRNNKTVYITGGACLMVGALGGGLYMATRPEMMVQQQNFGLVWKPRQEVTQVKVVVEELSTPSKPLIDEVTNTVYNSINDAVRKTGRSRWSIKTDPNFKFAEEVVETATA